ncbi:MAG TPA: TlyA family RNA methyltransferase [Chloroflexia bacterium]|nr:TlyA family RNA methyltransferase [Chloroflexia bacterium]
MKLRLDIAMVERGLAETRSRAQALIMAGDVLVDGQRVDRAGAQVTPESEISVRQPLPYVSRGGLKLAHALDVFGLRPRIVGLTALDIGASTGGFTDVLLQTGARLVYAVDVGTNQLAWKLRTDPRVVVMEQTNIRDLEVLPSASDLQLETGAEPPLADMATADVSFIGLDIITPAAIRLTAPNAFFVFLIKPQFEAGREKVGKGGVVRDPGVHHDVIIRLVNTWRDMGLYFAGLTRSPITGPAGNVEYLAHLEKGEPSADNQYAPDTIQRTVEQIVTSEVLKHGET